MTSRPSVPSPAVVPTPDFNGCEWHGARLEVGPTGVVLEPDHGGTTARSGDPEWARKMPDDRPDESTFAHLGAGRKQARPADHGTGARSIRARQVLVPATDREEGRSIEHLADQLVSQAADRPVDGHLVPVLAAANEEDVGFRDRRAVRENAVDGDADSSTLRADDQRSEVPGVAVDTEEIRKEVDDPETAPCLVIVRAVRHRGISAAKPRRSSTARMPSNVV